MPGRNKVFDVFISHLATDRELAAEIARVCSVSGLTAFLHDEPVASGDKWSDSLWEALSESKAVIAILPRSGPTPAMAIELGGARAWNKPIFGVLTDPTSRTREIIPQGIHFYSSSRIEDVIREIKRNRDEF